MSESGFIQTSGTPFTDGLEQGVLRYQSCSACDAPQTLTRYACAICGSPRLAWREAAGTGTVYATTLVNRAPSDEFRAIVPYLLLLVDLDEGPRVMAHGMPGLAIGDRAYARIQTLAGRPLLVFHPQRDDESTSIRNGETQ